MRVRVRYGLIKSIINRGFRHIQDMREESVKAQLQQQWDNNDIEINYDRVYKPSYTIEFDRTGEVVLFSCNPFKHRQIYLQYPYVLFESGIPLCLFMYLANPFSFSSTTCFSFFLLANTLWFPRVWQLHSLTYRIRKMSLLRGGRFLKLERQSLAGDTFTNWIEIKHANPLTEDFKDFDDRNEAEFLDESG